MSLKQPDNQFLRLTTREQSRQLDQTTIEEFGIDSITLMEIAGKQAAEYIHETTGNRASGIYICGKGNNAGDALVAARYLSEKKGHAISLLFVAGTDDFSDDAQRNYDLLIKLADNGSDITFLTDVKSTEIDWHIYDYAIDGMIGTGLSSDLRQPMADLVDELNNSNLPVFSMDIPTGLNCNSGEILGTCVEADHTITFGTNKIGFYLGDGPSVTGSITLAELPFPNYLREHAAVLVNKSLQEEFEEQETTAAHKYARGTVHIVAGSEGMTGAAIMAAKSAWSAGAGAVILYAPKGLLPIYEQVLPEIIKIPVGNSDDVHFTNRHAAQILEKIYEKEGVLLIGPGLGLASSTEKCVFKLLQTVEQPIILDADGLSAWKECGNLDKSNWLLTPHPGELEKYLNIPISSDANRLSRIEAFTKDNVCSLLSKGYPTMLSTHDGDTFITGYDTRMFARAGFGDVLAGTIAGKMAVSKRINQSITDALVSILEKAESVNEPQPSDIYDR